jgi:hypothetical protein
MPISTNPNAVGAVQVDDGGPDGATISGLFGYKAGSGGAVTQLTSKATAVEINTVCGTITLDDASLAAAAEVTFTVTNSKVVAVTDIVEVSLQTTTTGTPLAWVSSTAVGSFTVTVANLRASTANTSAEILNFRVFKSVAA